MRKLTALKITLVVVMIPGGVGLFVWGRENILLQSIGMLSVIWASILLMGIETVLKIKVQSKKLRGTLQAIQESIHLNDTLTASALLDDVMQELPKMEEDR